MFSTFYPSSSLPRQISITITFSTQRSHVYYNDQPVHDIKKTGRRTKAGPTQKACRCRPHTPKQRRKADKKRIDTPRVATPPPMCPWHSGSASTASRADRRLAAECSEPLYFGRKGARGGEETRPTLTQLLSGLGLQNTNPLLLLQPGCAVRLAVLAVRARGSHRPI